MNYIDQKEKKAEAVKMFVNVIEDDFPCFSDARFFELNRKTILSVSNALVTFLIIIIQFESLRFWEPKLVNCDCKYNNTK